MTTARKIQTLFAYYVQISTKIKYLWNKKLSASGASLPDPRYLSKASSPPPQLGVCRIDTAEVCIIRTRTLVPILDLLTTLGAVSPRISTVSSWCDTCTVITWLMQGVTVPVRRSGTSCHFPCVMRQTEEFGDSMKLLKAHLSDEAAVLNDFWL